ncbi:LysR family transcriptional regulator [Amycolatopsis sp.]|uniref:LysR family transcriptional regulator n=1 Tax=Amycolatopsis sp. TaxID=37632 RepID=UPI002CA5F5E5|nr:LysR family transcriptional regulator [Amycolatopsis sp.]HVV13431.1 LysR family transcriptional regulator [Amycolatopsis sp.]
MELRQLGYFVAVAEELSFTKAARRLRVVQSGVSTAIRALEREVGSPLFERDSRHVRLTDAGLAMLPEARATLAAARSAHDAVRESRGELHGSVAMGTLVSAAGIDVARLLGRFHHAHPKVRIRLLRSTTGSAGHITSLLAGTLDLALVAFPRRPPAGLISEDLGEDALALVCAQDHPLARARDVTPEELATTGFVEFPRGWGSREMVDLAFERAGLDRVVQLEVPDYDTLSWLVREKHGVAFIPESVARSLPGLTIVPVAMEPLRWKVSVAISATRPLSRAAHALLAAIRAAAH